jgi:tetratricopeptide (TPR) repeat protein
VLAARREADGLKVALKVARGDVPVAVAQLAREAEALCAAGPPAVPALLGEGRLHDGSPYLVLERVEARTLADRLAEVPGPLPLAEAVARALALLDALAALHAAGFAHCDLKPENVFVEDAPPRARLFDLGLAEPISRDGAGAGTFAGTAEYMAPEQVEGRVGPDGRADLYAAGVVLFEMLAGRPPFFGPEGEVRQAQLDRRPPRPSELAPVPPAVEEVVLRCLAKDREARYPSAKALRAALAAALEAAGPGPSGDRRAAAPAAAPAAQRRTVGLAFLESGTDAVSVQAAASPSGGVVAHADAGRYCVVFDATGSDNPVRLALRGAAGLAARGICHRVLVDLLPVTVHPRPRGPPRYLAAALGQAERYPRPADPEGILVAARAAALVPDERLALVPGREEVLRLLPPEAPEEPTIVRHGTGPLVGRDGVLAALAEAAGAAFAARQPALASALGESGLGKTHLAAVLAQRLRALPAAPEVLELRAREPGSGEEGRALRALLRWSLGLAKDASALPPVDGGRAFAAATLPADVVGETWPALAFALGWLPPEAPELSRLAAAPGALRSLTVRAAGESLRRRARSRPACVVLDDAHFADGVLLDAVEYAALAEAEVPLFACALARPAFAAARPSWGERAAHRTALSIPPLEPAAAAELCRLLLLPADRVPTRAVELLVERAQGVPSLLIELVRGLKRDGLLRYRARGEAWYLATDELERIPDMPLVEWLAGRELGALPPDLASHARLAALVGDGFGAAEVAGVLAELERGGDAATFPLDAQAGTRRLISAGVLVAHRGGRIGFRSPMLRDAFARTVPAALRARIHDAAFRYYRDATDLPGERRLPMLAAHASRSGRPEAAAEAWLRLADGQRRRHAYVEAEGLYSRTLEELPGRDRAGRLAALRGRGLMRYRIGRCEEAVADLAAAGQAATELGDAAARLECLLDEGTALDWMSDYARSALRVAEAETLSPASPSPPLAARLALAAGRTLFRAGRWPEAARALERAAGAAEALGDEGYEVRLVALLMQAVVLPNLGRPADADAVLERAEALCRERGDQLHLAAVFNNRRNVRVAHRDLPGAIDDLERTIRIGRDLGMAGIEYFGVFNIAELRYQAGEFELAQAHVRRAREIEARHPETAPFPNALLLEARLLSRLGQLAEARARLEEVKVAVERGRALGFHGCELGPSEEVLASMVDLATRGAGPEEWESLLARSRRFSVEQEPIEVAEMHGLAALRAGRVEEAHAALAGALQLARTIPNLMEGRLRGALREAGAGVGPLVP